MPARALTVLASLMLALPATAEPNVRAPVEPDPYSYAIAHGCKYEHQSADAYRATTRLLKREQPAGPAVKHRVHKWAVCVATRAKSHAVHRHVRRLWAWRHRYAHVWPILLNSQDPGWRAWADSTAWCESGGTMDPTIHNPSGRYHGLMQFDLPTWHEAGGSGDPHNASTAEQQVRGIRLARRVGTGRWPICGH